MATFNRLFFQRLGIQNIVSLVLVLCFTVPFITSLSYIQYQKKQIKKAIKERIIAGLHKKDLVRFQFSLQEKQNLHFEHSKEFNYQGKMYDIVFEEVRKDTVIYWCWHDHQETELNQKLNQLINLALEHSQEYDIFKILKKLFYISPTDFVVSVIQNLQFIVWKPNLFFYHFHSKSFIPPEIIG